MLVFWKRNILYILALSPMANFKIFSNCQAVLKLEFQFACSYGKGGGGDIYTKQRISHLTAMFQSRVYMVRKSVAKHIFWYLFFFLHTEWKKKKLAIVHAKKLPKMNRAKTAKSLPAVLGISALK